MKATDLSRRRMLQLGAVVAAALLAVGVLIAVSQEDAAPETKAPGTREPVAGTTEVPRLFKGIQQSGVTLGDPKAPVTMVEFADLQCVFCGQYVRDALPAILERYVRPGKVRLELRLLRFLGPDSVRGAQAATAAAAQDRLWQFTDLFFRNQGRENSGYVTDDFIRRLGRATPGLDLSAALEASGSNRVEQQLAGGEALAERASIQSTPSFLVGRTGDGSSASSPPHSSRRSSPAASTSSSSGEHDPTGPGAHPRLGGRRDIGLQNSDYAELLGVPVPLIGFGG